MASSRKEKSAVSQKPKVNRKQRQQDTILTSYSDHFVLPTASETSDDAVDSEEELHEENATFDITEMQLQNQLQSELDAYLERWQKSIRPASGSNGLRHNNVPTRRSNVFDLPKDGEATPRDTSRRSKRHRQTDDLGSATGAITVQKAKKKRKKIQEYDD